MRARSTNSVAIAGCLSMCSADSRTCRGFGLELGVLHSASIVGQSILSSSRLTNAPVLAAYSTSSTPSQCKFLVVVSTGVFVVVRFSVSAARYRMTFECSF